MGLPSIPPGLKQQDGQHGNQHDPRHAQHSRLFLPQQLRALDRGRQQHLQCLPSSLGRNQARGVNDQHRRHHHQHSAEIPGHQVHPLVGTVGVLDDRQEHNQRRLQDEQYSKQVPKCSQRFLRCLAPGDGSGAGEGVTVSDQDFSSGHRVPAIECPVEHLKDQQQGILGGQRGSAFEH